MSKRVFYKVSPGQRFGRLVALERISEPRKPARWLCSCDCGNSPSVRETSLTIKNTRSCGCLSRDYTTIRSFKHGLSRSPEYKIWQAMITRCTKPHAKHYGNYGGRGIKVCQSWLNSFQSFITDVGRRPSPQHTLDRVNNDGDYEPSNCRWTSRKIQQNNTRSNRRLEFQGETLTLHEWAERTAIPPKRIESRLRSGWSVEDTLTHPVIANGYRRWYSPKNKAGG